MSEPKFTLRMDKIKHDKLMDMSRATGINASSIVRGLVYKRVAEWEAEERQRSAMEQQCPL